MAWTGILTKRSLDRINKMVSLQKLLICAFSWLFLMLLWSCAPTVHLDTLEPLKVDISMKVDIYQRSMEPSSVHKMSEEESKALRNRDSRSAEIWAMKNDGVVVEGNNGYLEVQPKSGWDMQHVNQLVAEENRDRRILYEAEAQESARPVRVIEQEAGRRLREQAYGRPSQGATPSNSTTPLIQSK